MAITYTEIAGTGPSSSSVNNPSLDISSAVEGTLLLLCVGAQDSITPGTTPSGWTQVGYARNQTMAGARGFCVVYSKVAGASETTVPVPMSGLGYASGTVIQVSGSDATVGNVAVSNDGSTNTDYPTTPSISVAAGGDAILIVGQGDTGDTQDITPPSGFSEVVDRFGVRRSGVFVGKQSFPSAGSTGVLSAIKASGAEYNTVIIEVGAGTPSISPTTRENGFDIDASSSNTTPANYSVKINGGSAITPASVLQTGASSVRIRMPNGSRILSTDTVTISSTADSVTDESVTNNSKQTSTTIWHNGIIRTFASAPTVGILASGEPVVTNAVNVTAHSYDVTAGVDDQYTIHGSLLNPDVGTGAEHPFHPSSNGYNAATAVSYPLALSEDDCLLTAAAFPTMSTYAINTAFSLGDCVFEGSRYWRVTVAGTTSGTKPAFSSSVDTYTDGTVTWTRGTRPVNGDQGRSPVRKLSVLYCSGASLPSQDSFRPSYTSGATKRKYTTADIDDSILPTDANGSSDTGLALAEVEYPWFDLGYTLQSTANAVPEENQPTYSVDVSLAARNSIVPLLSNAAYKDELMHTIVQRGIDQLGLREGGGYPGDDSAGRSQGRMSFALVAAALLDQKSVWLPILKDNGIASDWDGSEFGAQLFYVDADDLLNILDGGYNYGDGLASGTWLNPTTDPTTLSPTPDSPANAYFPASIRGTWLHVPEWGVRHAQDPDRDSPTWSFTPLVNHYRQCCTAAYWGYIAYFCERLGILPNLDGNAMAFFDYLDRYEHIQGPDGLDTDWQDETLWTSFYEANRDAFAFTASAVIVGGTWYIDLNFNRYATQTDANIASQFGCSGGITLSNADQTGPRTFRVEADADPRGQTITYTQSGTAANRVVDAGNNELPTASTTRVPVSGTGQVQAEGTIRMNFQLPSGLWGSTITKNDTKITLVSQVTGGSRSYTVGSVTGAGTSTLQVILTPTPLIYSTASGGTVTVTIDEGWLTDENGNTTAAFSGIADGDNSSTQVPATGGVATTGNFGINTAIRIGV